MTTLNDNDEEFAIPESLEAGCMRANGWSQEFTPKAIVGYRQFMKLKLQLEDWDATQLSPSLIVDKVWHHHLLYPGHYYQACQDYAGHLIDHNPNGGLDKKVRSKRLENTQMCLKTLFGRKIDATVWSFEEDNTTGTERKRPRRHVPRRENSSSESEDEEEEEADPKSQRRPTKETSSSKSDGNAVDDDNDNNKAVASITIQLLSSTRVTQEFKHAWSTSLIHPLDDFQMLQRRPLFYYYKNTLVDGCFDSPQSLGMKKSCHHPSNNVITAVPPLDPVVAVRSGDSTITIRILEQSGERTCLQSTMHTRLYELFGKYARRKGADVNSLRFLLDGEQVEPWETPKMHKMDDQDELLCLIQQTGC